jgi:site-specific DNA-methyltransferase (adenine-specific)
MIEIHHGDCQKLSSEIIEPESVDLIFTDPPYSKKYLPLYKWLAKEAARSLKPNGFLITYCGPYWKDRVMNYLNAELQYFYDFIYRHNGNTTILWNRKIISGYKSLLCFHRKNHKPMPKTNVLGLFNGIGGDKRFHKWGQEENTARYYIDCFSRENDLVIDYFLGAGTFGNVCKKLNRKFIGFEIDEETFQIADLRIKDEKFDNSKSNQTNFLTELEAVV